MNYGLKALMLNLVNLMEFRMMAKVISDEQNTRQGPCSQRQSLYSILNEERKPAQETIKSVIWKGEDGKLSGQKVIM